MVAIPLDSNRDHNFRVNVVWFSTIKLLQSCAMHRCYVMRALQRVIFSQIFIFQIDSPATREETQIKTAYLRRDAHI